MNTENESKSSDVEVFVYKRDNVAFACPSCKLEKSIQAEKIKDIIHWNINATCQRCAHKFSVSFNFRKFYRKETSLDAELVHPSRPDHVVDRVRVTDLSLMGLGFESHATTIRPGEVLQLRFALDDAGGALLERQIMVESVRGAKVGGSFVGVRGFDAVLGNYILGRKN